MSKKRELEDKELDALLEEYQAPKKEEVIEVSKKAMEKHKDAFEKLEDNSLSESAFGVFKNSDGKYELVEIKFSSITMEGRVHRTIKTESNKAMAYAYLDNEVRRQYLNSSKGRK